MFVQKLNIYSVVVALQNGTPIYAQPIHIMQNRWESSMLNSWNEDLTIDEDNGIILSTMMGAGYKDDANSFNGVLMGDVGSTAGIQNVGLYGFHQGAQSFGFDINGTAFLGKEGAGRINFNGNEGTISSAVNDNGAEMTINIDKGIIDILGPRIDNKQARVYMSIDGSSNPYFMLKSKQGNPLMEISDTKYYLQTDDYETSASSYQGVKLDLQKKTLTAGSFTIKAKNDTNFITVDSAATAYPLSIGTSVDGANFRVKWDGTLMATNGKFTGDITGGTIAIGHKFSVDNEGNVIAKKITVNSGTDDPSSIAGWIVDNNSIRTGTLGSAGSMWLCRNGTTASATIGSYTGSGWCIGIGSSFGVLKNGNLYAKDVDLSGIVSATSGNIGGFTFSGGEISNANGISFKTTGAIATKTMEVAGSFSANNINANKISGTSTYLNLNGSGSTSKPASASVSMTVTDAGSEGVLGFGWKAGKAKFTVTTSHALLATKTFTVSIVYGDYGWGEQTTKTITVTVSKGSSTGSTETVYRVGPDDDKVKSYNLSPTSWTDVGSGSSTAIECKGHFIPASDKTYALGDGTHYWTDIYATNGTIVTSDMRQKYNILPLQSSYLTVFDNLSPVTYQMHGGASGRTHIGLVAQEVETAILDAGLTTQDFAAICKIKVDDKITYGLRYDELVPLCIAKIQELQQRILNLEEQKEKSYG